MSRGSRPKKRKSRKRLAYACIAVAFILISLTTYFSLYQSNQTSQPKAAIVDHLSRREPNQTFVQESREILKTRFSVIDYYGWDKVNVTFFKNLFAHGYSLIVLRVHSAITIADGKEFISLFTWEDYDPNNIPPEYAEDIWYDRLVEAYFSEEERASGERYYGITQNFVETYGKLQKTVIIMMGCTGLKYDVMAEAFRKKGAKVCIGWDGLVSTRHTDHATTFLLQYLAQGYTIKRAVNETMNKVGPEKSYFQIQGYNSTLKYYPEDGNYTIPYTVGSSSMDTLRTSTFLVKEEKKGIRSNWLQ